MTMCAKVRGLKIVDRLLTSQSHVSAVVERFHATAEGSPERAQLGARELCATRLTRSERKYGRSTLARYVQVYEEEAANREWYASNTTSCPHCRVSVERSFGCAHMCCSKCGTHFCDI